jgi:hypothetical protein
MLSHPTNEKKSIAFFSVNSLGTIGYVILGFANNACNYTSRCEHDKKKQARQLIASLDIYLITENRYLLQHSNPRYLIFDK